MILRGIATALAVLALAGAAGAQELEPFVVKDIRVEGLQRTEPGTVFSYLPVKVGERMDAERARQALRALFATGFFADVRLEAESGGVLVVLVRERPAVAQIDFSGINQFDTETLRKVLRDLGLAEGRTFDRSVLETAEQELKRQYLSRGMYGATVQTTVTPLERNRVGIAIAVTEGDVAKIQGINIVGSQAFSESELLGLFVLRTPGWLTWYTKHDTYARERLAADLETLRSYYQNRGYLDFTLESTQVSITPDRRDIYVTVNISEGEIYTVSEVTLAGQILVPREELEPLIQLKPGDVFSREKLAASTKAISDRLGNEGYAFANASAIPTIDKENRRVAFSIVVDPGRRVYVRRIDVSGNTKTRDEVVRREMRQLEGAYYDASKIQLSRRRIDRTSFFGEVSVETLPVEGHPDQVDVVYSVKEKQTGSLLIGLGFSSVEKVALSASVTQANVFGTGKYLSANINSGSVNQVYSLSYFDPFYTVYKREVDASNLAVGPYVSDSVGGGVKFGYPVSEQVSVDFGLNLEAVELNIFANSPLSYIDFVRSFGNEYTYLSGTMGVARDTRDSLITTTAGSYLRASFEISGGDLSFYRLGYQHQWYYPMSRALTLHLGGEIGYGLGYGDRPLPFFKNYFAGGPGSVRGYRSFSLGPRDSIGNTVGGNYKVIGIAEILFPMPGAEHDRSVRLAAFVDAGQVYADKIELGEMRSAVGVGLFWSSPMGPLRLSLAHTLNAKSTDQKQALQFTFGTGF
jgi:outer membrane protein insertion porin family